MSQQTINIDPKELSDTLLREIFKRWAAKGKLHPRITNQWHVNVQYGREGGPEQGKILFAFVTDDDIHVQIKFSVTRYVQDKTYLDDVVADTQEMIIQKRKDRSPIIIPNMHEKRVSEAVKGILH